MKEQKEFPLGPMPTAGMRFVSWDLVGQCADEMDAIQLAWQSRRPRCSVEKGAGRMGVTKGTLSKYLHGQLGMSPDRQRAFERVVGNRAVSQYTAYASGCMLTLRELSETEKQAQEIADLKARIAEMQAA